MGSTVFAVTLATLSQLSLASRPMITLMEHSNGLINEIKSFSQPPQHGNRLRCSLPCQRLPNMVKLQPILMQYGVNKNIVDLIETNDENWPLLLFLRQGQKNKERSSGSPLNSFVQISL